MVSLNKYHNFFRFRSDSYINGYNLSKSTCDFPQLIANLKKNYIYFYLIKQTARTHGSTKAEQTFLNILKCLKYLLILAYEDAYSLNSIL